MTPHIYNGPSQVICMNPDGRIYQCIKGIKGDFWHDIIRYIICDKYQNLIWPVLFFCFNCTVRGGESIPEQ